MKNGFAPIGAGAGGKGNLSGETRRLSDALDALLDMAKRGFGRTREEAVVAKPEPHDAKYLREAFHTFNDAAQRLENSYVTLRTQVTQLSEELQRANDELARQLIEKQALVERQQSLLAALPAGVVVVGPCGTVRDANEAAKRFLGTQLIGACWQDAAARLMPAESAFEWFTPGESPRRIGLEEQSLGAGRDRIVLLHDVTEAHAARQRLERNERLATMGEMAARLAHQLRTPLSTAMLYAGQIEHADVSDAARTDAARKLIARLRSLERVTREMLSFVRGDRAPESTIVVSTLLGEATQVMEPLIAARGIAFNWEDHTGGASLRGDRRGLVAALLSLLENALQATQQGGKIRLEGMANSARIRICVSDTGSGIEHRSLPRLFEPFFSTRADGTGLGLAIVKSVVEAHGGSIDVDSSEEQGTRFTIILPRGSGETSLALPRTPQAPVSARPQDRLTDSRGHAGLEREAA
jgi:two-component system sensor histidine kinase FlrB